MIILTLITKYHFIVKGHNCISLPALNTTLKHLFKLFLSVSERRPAFGTNKRS